MDNKFLTKEVVINFLENHGATNITVSGTNIYCPCPLHGGDNPTGFVWNIDKSLWHCFTSTCGGGSIYDFVAVYYEIDINNHFIEVVRKVEEIFNIKVDTIRTANELSRWTNYLNFIKENNVPEFNLKLLGTLRPLKEYRGLSGEFLKQNEVYYSEFYNRVCCVVRDEENKIVGCVLRYLGSTKRFKWVNKPSTMKTGMLLYNLNNCIGKYDTVYVVEGIMDVLNLKRLGIENVVGCFSATLTDYQRYLLQKYFFNVVLMYDNDNAGQIATRKAIKALRMTMNIKIANYEGKDPGELKEANIKYIGVMEYDR